MKNKDGRSSKEKGDQPENNIQTTRDGQTEVSVDEPYVDADNIAEFICERRQTVVKMARERRITCYPMSGRRRHTYKFKRSEVAADLTKLRRPSLN